MIKGNSTFAKSDGILSRVAAQMPVQRLPRQELLSERREGRAKKKKKPPNKRFERERERENLGFRETVVYLKRERKKVLSLVLGHPKELSRLLGIPRTLRQRERERERRRGRGRERNKLLLDRKANKRRRRENS